MPVTQGETLLVERIRAGDQDAWRELIARYEGRLLAYVGARLRDRQASEDLVQETLVGFLTSLPNYDVSRPLESYLFRIAAHKLTDHLRREGRRPMLPLSSYCDTGDHWEPAGRERAASSIVRSHEGRHLQAGALARALAAQIERWRGRGDWVKLKCVELLVVRGLANKQVAGQLALTEQQVANFKFEFIARLRRDVAEIAESQSSRTPPADPAVGQGHDAELAELDDSPGVMVSGSELQAYLDEALPPARMAEIEELLQNDSALVDELSRINQRRNAGLFSIGEIWRQQRISCLAREDLGSWMLGVLDDSLSDYVRFHVDAAGCRYCLANLDDLKTRQAELPDAQRRRQHFFESSAGYLRTSE